MDNSKSMTAAREVRRVRAEALRNLKGGLRARYRTLEWTRPRPLARPSRAFCFAKFLSPFPKQAQVPGANPLKDALLPAILPPSPDFGGTGDRACKGEL
jgi:hypothetical protein